MLGRAELRSFRRAEQTMGMPATERSWTREEVLDLIARNPLDVPRYELVDGVLLVTPGPTNVHQRAVGRMSWLLSNYLEIERGVGEAFTSPADVMPEEGTTVGPDVFVIPPDEARRVFEGGPYRTLALVIEVLSPGDRSGDRSRKRRLYHRTVPEYWIVDTDSRTIEVWKSDARSFVAQAEFVEWNPAGAMKPFFLDVKAYFARVFREDL